MQQNIHYLVESRYWRRDVPNIHDETHNETPRKEDLVETKKEFRHEFPIEARKAAFQHFASILDVLYEGLGILQTTDKQARKDLQNYFDSGNGIEYLSKYPDKRFKMLSRDDIHNRIEIYMVTNGRKKAIHGLRCLEYTDGLDEEIIENLKCLILEYKLYKQLKYTTDNLEININFEPIGGKITSILKNPVDWKKLMVTYSDLKL